MQIVVGNGPVPAGATKVSQLQAVPWATLTPGSRVIVYAGTYAGPVTMNANGSASARITVEGSPGVVVNNSVDVNGASFLTVSGLKVQGAQYGGFIIRLGSHDITIKGNTIASAQMGIDITDGAGTGIVISGNLIEDSVTNGIGVEISAAATARNLITGNTIRRSGHHGIEMHASYWTIERNSVSFSGLSIAATSGIHLFNGYSQGGNAGCFNIVRFNTSFSNVDRSESDGNGIQVDMFCDNNTVAYNNVYGNDGPGINLYGAGKNVVYRNNAMGNCLDPMVTHGSLGEIVLCNYSPDYAGARDNRLFDNIATSTRAEVPALYVDSRTFQLPNVVGPNLLANEFGVVLRWSDSLYYKSTPSVDGVSGLKGLVELIQG